MRSLTATQTTAQKSRTGITIILKVVLTSGANTYTYTPSRIMNLSHTEKQFSHSANIFLDDSDKVLHGLDLEGYKAVISYGFTTSAGDEYSACAPLYVIGQQRDSYRGRLLVSLNTVGIMDLLADDKASAVYNQLSTNTSTVQTLITAIAGATLAPYTHCTAYTVTYDSTDALLTTFIPADFFQIGLNDNRLAKLKELLAYTTCKMVVKADGAIHIFVPVTTGVVYDYEYSLADTYHIFFSKRFRRRLVFPNYIVVSSHPDQGSYTGTATDPSYTLIEKREHYYMRPTSNAQAISLAEAILSRYQIDAEAGAANIPLMNIGAEVYDYVNITDSRAGDSRAGNLGWLTRHYEPGKFSMDFGFGKASILPLFDLAPALTDRDRDRDRETRGERDERLYQQLKDLYDKVNEILELFDYYVSKDEFNKWMHDFQEDAWFRKVTVKEQLIIPIWS